MKNKNDLIKFNMTEIMSSSLIEFNKLKHELNSLKENYSIKNKEKINLIEKRLEELKIIFIKEFKQNNVDEIKKYLREKDQN